MKYRIEDSNFYSRTSADVLLNRFAKLILGNALLVQSLEKACKLGLPDWWIVGGAIRNTVWSEIISAANTYTINDIDLIYFDNINIDKYVEKSYESNMSNYQNIRWSIKNQARMHLYENNEPFEDTTDAIRHFPETISCVAIKFDSNKNLIVMSLYGLEDLFQMVIRPTPYYINKFGTNKFIQRVNKKGWLRKWPQAKITEV